MARKKGFRPPVVYSGPVVAIIAENWLAAAYLMEIMQRDPSISCIHYKSAGEGNAAPQIFVVDEFGLQPPISLYLKKLRQTYSGAKYIALSNSSSSAHIAELVAFGIDGFLTHGEVPGSLLSAVAAVALGRLWIPPQALELSVRRFYQNDAANLVRTNSITRREYEILQLVQARLTNREIANLIEIQESTVKFHISNIFAKLQITNRRELSCVQLAGHMKAS